MEYEGRHRRNLTRAEINERLGEAVRTIEAIEQTLSHLEAAKTQSEIDDEEYRATREILREERESAKEERVHLLSLL